MPVLFSLRPGQAARTPGSVFQYVLSLSLQQTQNEPWLSARAGDTPSGQRCARNPSHPQHEHSSFAPHLPKDALLCFPLLWPETFITKAGFLIYSKQPNLISVILIGDAALAIVFVSEEFDQDLCEELLLTYAENIKIHSIETASLLFLSL